MVFKVRFLIGHSKWLKIVKSSSLRFSKFLLNTLRDSKITHFQQTTPFSRYINWTSLTYFVHALVTSVFSVFPHAISTVRPRNGDLWSIESNSDARKHPNQSSLRKKPVDKISFSAFENTKCRPICRESYSVEFKYKSRLLTANFLNLLYVLSCFLDVSIDYVVLSESQSIFSMHSFKSLIAHIYETCIGSKQNMA